MEVDAAVIKRKKDEILKDFGDLVDVEFVKSIDFSKIFKKQFINKLEKWGSDTFGLVLTLNDSAIMIAYNMADKEGLYISVPAIDSKTKNSLAKYIDIVFEKGGAKNEKQEDS